MKKELFYFNKFCSNLKNTLINEDADGKVETEVNVEVDGQPVEANIETTAETDDGNSAIESENIENNNLNFQLQNLITNLNIKLADIKKKVYASRLYSTNVGNNPNALKDYGYFLGQKDLLYSLLKELTNLNSNITIEDKKNE